MNSTLKVSKYLFRDFKKGMLIFYGIVFAVVISMTAFYYYIISKSNGHVYFGGLGFSAFIFIFVSGLNCFKVSFKFLQANNVSRKRFYYANVITLVSVSGFMALIDTIMTKIIKLIMPYENMAEQLYKNDFFFSNFMWSFSLFVLVASTGWCITMLYYRCNNLMKTVISIAPVLIVILIAMLDTQIKGAIGIAIAKFLTVSLGFTNNNPYMAVLSFSIASVGVFGLCYLLIRRITIRD